MSGHSKWATIKRKKGKADQERGKIFTRHIKEITIAAREGGGDPAGNPRLRTAIASAKGVNMPQDNIKRAILKGTGELPGVKYESVTYEGYGPNGVAIYMEVMTDNKNRTVSEVRHILTRYGGNLGSAGCVAWMFDKKGIITVDTEVVDEDTLMEICMENGAIDISSTSGAYEIITEPNDLDDCRMALEKRSIPMVSAEVTMIPQNSVRIDKENDASSMLKMVDSLEENDDVQKVYTNFDIDEAVLEKLA
ncbi:MAG: YebC/PmpR family DNA-binding transcriptional regulator [candidate division Zixibacteria bacterium]|nr:YebC/PmpR family DNA-binding transcriptional regulator [candidate division Zixibacteria bacterium]MDD5425103.1 YebC/PmpR family DNA-binding transcriptional regulator [candidate division Zixibacteria bacterium]